MIGPVMAVRLVRVVAAVLVGLCLGAVGSLVGGSSTPPEAELVIGPEGVPLVDYGGELGVQENPVTVAQWAMMGDGEIVTAADWLVDNQERDGSWRYEFPWVMSAGRLPLEPGWASGMAQGHALTVFALAYDETGDGKYVTAARHAFEYLMTPVDQGSVATTLDGGLWFEEYPTDPPSYVLNGFVYTLDGLWDVRDLVPGALDAYERGAATLEANIERWDIDGKVAYDLVGQTTGAKVWWNPKYDEVHERILRRHLERTPSPQVQAMFDYWYG